MHDFIALDADNNVLGEVTITAKAKQDSEATVVAKTKNSTTVQSGVSSQQIQKTQDKDASEVIKRIPGISIIDDKFVMVRGLSQRYNNVWVNGSAVPSSEADSRAFSFDIIPSSQLDNIMIVKSPAPEYPADFSGGFILVNTKNMPTENSYSVSIGGNINSSTHFKNFTTIKGSATDFLGFDNGFRNHSGGINGKLNPLGSGINLQGNGFNNDWSVKTTTPYSDFSLSANVARTKDFAEGDKFGLIGAVNYSNSYRTQTGMINNLFGAYDFYPVDPVSGQYEMGTPLFPELKLHLNNGKTFTVLAPNVNKQNIYVQSVKVNGQVYDKTYLTHQQIMDGATVEFEMGPQPKK